MAHPTGCILAGSLFGGLLVLLSLGSLLKAIL